MAMITRTLLFQIHNPSTTTGAILHRSIRAYTNAARAVLQGAWHDWPRIKTESMRQDKLNGMMLAVSLRTWYRARTSQYPMHSSLRDALFADLAGALLSYDTLHADWMRARTKIMDEAQALCLDLHTPHDAFILLSQDEQKALNRLRKKARNLGRPPSFPTAPRTKPDQHAYDEALERAAEDGSTIPRAQEKLDSLIQVGTRPLSFPRPDGPTGSRNFALLHSSSDGRYYAMMYILPAGDPRCRPLAVPPPEGKRGVLSALNKAGTVVKQAKRPATSVVLPLAFGSWHEETALKEALNRPESVRVAKLIHQDARRQFGRRRPERFLLAVTFEQVAPDPGHVLAHMGVYMDEQSRVSWVIRDAFTHAVVERGTDESLVNLAIRWREDRRMHAKAGRIPPRAHHIQAEQVKHTVHILVNRLVARATTHQALVAVADNTYLRTMKRAAPIDPETGKHAPRNDAWHDAAAAQNYRRTTLVVGDMQRILGYKLPRAGLFKPLSIGGISPRDCAACGERGTDELKCAACGAPLDGMNSAGVAVQRIPEIVDRIAAARAKRLAAKEAAEAAENEE